MRRRRKFGLHNLKARDRVSDANDQPLPRPVEKVSGGFAELLGPSLKFKPRQELLSLFCQFWRAGQEFGITGAKLLSFKDELVMAFQALAALPRKSARPFEGAGELARHSGAGPAQFLRGAL